MEREPPQVDSDEALIARAKRDREAFGDLYDRYVTQVYQFAYRRVRNHATAEEITAKVFHRALEQLGRFEWRGLPFGAWLIRIAANSIHDHNGHVQRQVSLGDWLGDEADVLGSDLSAEERYTDRQTADILWRTVETLPVVQQEVLMWRFARDMSMRDIADRMGRTEGAVKQLLFRAMQGLRQRLQHLGFHHEA